ncbi:MAG TPA: DnaD domain protein [Symbiobacteriaceae bacterium]|nr:DnaD domain protein [Symbiobacteriaceae bacterium]
MSRGSMEIGELDFLQALLKRGFVTIPRMVIDYVPDLGLDYDTLGKLFTLFSWVGGPAESAFGVYAITRRAYPHDFDQMRSVVIDLQNKDIVRIEQEGDTLAFSLIPLFSRLRVHWVEHGERLEQEIAASGPDPVLAAAQKLLGRPLSDREVADIQDWVTTYGYEVDMVQTIIREGQRQGVTRMTYLNQIARQWHEENIRTPEEAEQYLQRYRKSAAKHKAIISYLGIKRQLSGAEQALFDRWTDEWGFGTDVIMKACDLAAGSHNPLQYVNKVLENWRDRGVRTVADTEQLEAEHKRRSVAAGSDPGRAAKAPKSAPNRNSNVFLKREKKDDSYYDQLFKKLDE